jgi:hypothetical protein
MAWTTRIALALTLLSASAFAGESLSEITADGVISPGLSIALKVGTVATAQIPGCMNYDCHWGVCEWNASERESWAETEVSNGHYQIKATLRSPGICRYRVNQIVLSITTQDGNMSDYMADVEEKPAPGSIYLEDATRASCDFSQSGVDRACKYLVGSQTYSEGVPPTLVVDTSNKSLTLHIDVENETSSARGEVQENPSPINAIEILPIGAGVKN